MELLRQAQELKAKEKQIKEENKKQQATLILQFQDGLSEEDKAKEIQRAEQILKDGQTKADKIRAEFRKAMSELKEDMNIAKELLEMVNYKQKNSLRSVQQLRFEGLKAIYTRKNILPIELDISKPEIVYRSEFTEALKAQGIQFKAFNGDTNKAGENIVSIQCKEIRKYLATYTPEEKN